MTKRDPFYFFQFQGDGAPGEARTPDALLRRREEADQATVFCTFYTFRTLTPSHTLRSLTRYVAEEAR